MAFELREQFIILTMRLKKVDLCPSAATNLQPSEIAVMARASSSCMLSEDGVCVSEIHQDLYISKAAVSQTLNSLQKKGYILRRIDPNDRRKVMVTVTELGEAELKRTRQLYDEMLDLILERFGRENAESLIQLIELLMNCIDEIQSE